MTVDEIGESVYQLLLELDQTSLTDLIADICTVNGWFSEVRLETAPQYTEILASKTIPYPESVRIAVKTATRLDDGDIEEVTTRESDDGHLSTIVVKEKPTDEALLLAREQGISIVAISDLTEEILSQGTIDLVINYASNFDRIATEYDDEIAVLKRRSDTSTVGTTEPSKESGDASNSMKQPRDRPHTENDRLSIGLIGYDFYTPSTSTDGVFVAVKIEAKQPVELSAEDFSLSFTDGGQHSAVSQADSSSLSSIAGTLQPEWTFGTLSLEEGEVIKYVLYVPRSNDIENPDAVFVDNLRIPLIPPVSSQTYRGLPGPIVNVMNELLGYEFKKGHKESYVSYGIDEDPEEHRESQAQIDTGAINESLQDGFPTYQESKTYPKLSGEGPSAVGKYFSLEFLGHTYLTHLNDPGMLFAVTVGARALDLEIRPNNFTLHSEDDMTYQGASGVPILDQAAGSLTPSWSAEREKVSAGGKRTYVLFFPAEEEFVPKKLRYQSAYKRFFTMSYSQVEEQLEEGKNAKTALEIELTSEHPDLAQDVFEGRSAVLDSILAVHSSDRTADKDVYRSVLSAETTGAEDNRFAVEVMAWEFYQGQDSDKNQDGIFMSIDITGKHPGQAFEHENIRLIDDNGYMYEGEKSAVLKEISSNDSLPSPWTIAKYGGIAIPDDSTVKTLVHILCAEQFTTEKIQLHGGVMDATGDIPANSWAELRGLPTPVDDMLSSMGYER